MLDVAKIREDFPILRRRIHGHPLIYLDNAATSQKPQVVLDALVNYYSTSNANVHRGVHTLGEEATAAYEAVRAKIAAFIGAAGPSSIVLTRNTTEAINLVARAWGGKNLRAGDEILLTEMEHHSNLVPWQLIARERGARLRFLGITSDGLLDVDQLPRLLGPRTRLVALTHMSNVLGTINPVAEVARAAHGEGALVLVDGAQSVPHFPVGVGALECDFLAFSAHKMLGPTGVGVLWARPELLAAMDPFLGGGEMIREVQLERATWNDVPWKFEAGTPNIADGVAFGAALDYLQAIGMEEIAAHEASLAEYALELLREVDDVKVYGPTEPAGRGGVISFNCGAIHPHDLSTILDRQGVEIRAGHHCAQPLMRRLGVMATARASFALYNTRAEVDALVGGLAVARGYFGHVARAAR